MWVAPVDNPPPLSLPMENVLYVAAITDIVTVAAYIALILLDGVFSDLFMSL
jgi:hypothetical protein